jgi:hypothetical protein
MRKAKTAQAILDYVMLLLILVAGLLIMRYYIRNAFSGKWREASDTIGQGETYAPGKTHVEYQTQNK